jgi:hypothetical protein
MIFWRFLLRFMLVPTAAICAVLVAAVVACIAHWEKFLKLVANDPTAPDNIVLAVIILGPAVVIIMSVGAFGMLTPAALGIAISEIFAIRSILYHLANGSLASGLGWVVFTTFLKDFEFYSDPTPSIAAGIAAGFVYWAIAGWTAGFWKPVFAQPTTPNTPVTAQSS